jgi:dCTP deaminase
MLGHTMETITLSDRVAARLEGRSSYGRLGLVIHSTAGFIDPGFTGQITLEMSNLAPHPIVLRPGTRIGQVCFIPLTSPAESPYGIRGGSKYQGQTGATASRAHRDTH